MPPDGIRLWPEDDANRALLQNVHPPNWVNPRPSGRYNLVVIGAGTAGLVTAAIAAGLGAKVALIEKHLMGGDCLNVGCVPSKGLIAASRAWTAARDAERFGVSVSEVRRDFGAAMARMRTLRARISANDSARRFTTLGVDVYLGEARFVEPGTIEVAGARLSYKKAALCTGARAAAPEIPGLEEAGYRTNETLFSLTELPRRLAVIGAGPIGCEMAQAFARFGSTVTVLERMSRILPREDLDAADIVRNRMQHDGVEFVFDAAIARIDRRAAEKILAYRANGATKELAVDEILIGVGRAPNVEGLGLDRVGVRYDPREGIAVNARLQTSHPDIFAAGDVCSRYKFTHAADAMAQIVIQNALFPHPIGLGYANADALIMPWCTYTEPELAHVGLYEGDARKRGLDVETYTYALNEVDRAILDGTEDGFVRLHVQTRSDRILGASIVAPHAGEMIAEIGALMQAGGGVKTLLATIHPYPTHAEAIKKAGVLWRKAHFSERQKRMLARWFQWIR